MVLRHTTMPGQNDKSVYLTCLKCRKHATWLYTDTPSFDDYPALAFMKEKWQAMKASADCRGQQVRASTSPPIPPADWGGPVLLESVG